MPAEIAQPTTETKEAKQILRLPAYLRRAFNDQLLKGLTVDQLLLYEEPNADQAINNVVRAFKGQEKDWEALKTFLENPKIGEFVVRLLLPDTFEHYDTIGASGRVQSLIQGKKPLEPSREYSHQITWPQAHLDTGKLRVDAQTAKETMAIIGDGAAGLFMGRMRAELGYLNGTTKLFSRSGKTRGIWNHDRVVDEGHNTFATAIAWKHILSAEGKRTGKELQDFLDSIGNPTAQQQLVHAEIKNIKFDVASKKYLVRYVDGEGKDVEARVDSVCVCTGNRLPRRLDSPNAPMQTNAHTVKSAHLKRWQEQIPREKYELYRGKNPVVVGLGNSAMAMIGEFLKLEKQGVEVNPVILTHHSRQALRRPTEFFMGKNGKPERMFRDRFDLSRLAGDIPEIKTRYTEALERGWIVTDVVRWEVADVNNEIFVQAETRDGQTRNIPHVPAIFALIGYQNDAELMRNLGCTLASDDGVVDFDVATHRVKNGNDNNRLYVLGSAASTPDNRNEEVIPGIMNAVGKIAFTDIVAAHRNRPSKAQVREQLAQNLDPIGEMLATQIIARNDGKPSVEETRALARQLILEIFGKDDSMKGLLKK